MFLYCPNWLLLSAAKIKNRLTKRVQDLNNIWISNTKLQLRVARNRQKCGFIFLICLDYVLCNCGLGL